MKRLILPSLTLVFLWVAPATAARPGPDVSWGKPGVAFAQYRADTIACGRAGAGTSMAEQEAYKTVILGLSRQDLDIDNARTGDSVDALELARRQSLTAQRAQFSRNVGRLQGFLVSGVERCLIGRGYTRFALAKDQQRHLARLARGSDDRFRYLHRLASDAAVVGAQAVEPTPAGS